MALTAFAILEAAAAAGLDICNVKGRRCCETPVYDVLLCRVLKCRAQDVRTAGHHSKSKNLKRCR